MTRCVSTSMPCSRTWKHPASWMPCSTSGLAPTRNTIWSVASTSTRSAADTDRRVMARLISAYNNELPSRLFRAAPASVPVHAGSGAGADLAADGSGLEYRLWNGHSPGACPAHGIAYGRCQHFALRRVSPQRPHDGAHPVLVLWSAGNPARFDLRLAQ